MNRSPPSSAVVTARREALLVFAIWLAACAYSLTVCYRFGYGRDAATLTYVLGFPDWVFWGVIAPWCVCTALAYWLAYVVIADEELAEEQAAPPMAELGAGGEVSHD